MNQNYSLELQQILSGINHLKGLVAKLGVAASAAPSIDFAVDMFDRPDTGVLDGYWGDTAGNWTLRSGMAIPQATAQQPTALSVSSMTCNGISALNLSGLIVDSYSPFWSLLATNFSATMITSAVSLFPLTTTQQFGANNVYAGAMSSKDLNVKVTFQYNNAPSARVNTQTTGNYSDVFSIPVANYGAVFGNTAGRYVGTVMSHAIYTAADHIAPLSCSMTAHAVSQPTASGSLNVLDRTLAPVSLAWSLFGDASGVVVASGSKSSSAAINAFTTVNLAANQTSFTDPGWGGPVITLTEGTRSNTFAPTTTLPIQTGLNTLLMQAVGNTYTVYLNGVQIYTETSSRMIDRSRVGLSAYGFNTLGSIITNGLQYSGITSFKAWPYGLAEPADQTGRGTYAGGYNDKYHSATGAYNPLA